MAHFFKQYTLANLPTPWSLELRLGQPSLEEATPVLASPGSFETEAEINDVVAGLKADMALEVVRDIEAPEEAPGGGGH